MHPVEEANLTTDSKHRDKKKELYPQKLQAVRVWTLWFQCPDKLSLPGGACPVFAGIFMAISHAHAETVLLRITYCRFHFDVRLSLGYRVLEQAG
ncbi:MAG TPA: hypothetical protein VF501_03700 [Thiobacillus sp.]